MALVIGNQETRVMPIEAKEPLNGDKTRPHKFNVEYDILPESQWRGMTERWAELQQMAHKMRTDPDYTMSDNDIEEAREPLYKVVAPYVKNIGPLEDESGNAIEFTEDVKDKLLGLTWIQSHIVDGFMAVQRGMTMADYKRARAKN